MELKDERSLLCQGCNVKEAIKYQEDLMKDQNASVRLVIQVTGVVQGVGFRPFVYNLAARYSLGGYVRNTSGEVEIELQGSAGQVKQFLAALSSQQPPLAIINSIQITELPVLEQPQEKFTIQSSTSKDSRTRTVPPDTATCACCFKELFDPDNRRFRYPFINCTNCGPRFTIIQSLPYDRPATTMSTFAMCNLCQSEYDDPGDRRFHAQPNACPTCGPSLTFVEPNKQEIRDSHAALDEAVRRLSTGGIIAAKGLGGFHLLCDANNEESVLRLRRVKGRYGKPMALMMRNLEMVRIHCQLAEAEAALLSGTASPIVLVKKSSGSNLSAEVAPGVDEWGVMLPYTPLHHLLLADLNRPLIATSGNRTDEPICIDNDEALHRLADIADAFLLHNRPIESRYDDTVTRVWSGVEFIVRRSRGYAPLPINLPFTAEVPVLACGAHLKNTFCLIDGNRAFVSQHIGDLDNRMALDHFHESLTKFLQLFSISPQLVAHDLHPDYLSTEIATQFAAAHNIPAHPVQHHHAHIVACMIEHNVKEPVIGVAFDGLGLGPDGVLWGGEFLICTWNSWQRRAFFQPVALPGGSAAIKQPWRMALSYLQTSHGQGSSALAALADQLSGQVDRKTFNLVSKQMDSGVNSPLTSSCGRLFDAVSALLGVCPLTSYEGQAAIELEALARSFDQGSPGASGEELVDRYDYELEQQSQMFIIKPFPILDAVTTQLQQKVPLPLIAATFHRTIADIILQICLSLRCEDGLSQVCLSGGVFQNMLLLHETRQRLEKANFTVYTPQRLPANDSGVSLGQAVVALSQSNAIIPAETHKN